MKRIAIAISAVLLGVTLSGAGLAQGRHDQMPHGPLKAGEASAAMQDDPSKPGIALKDGGKLVFRQGGTVYHTNASGRRVRMKDGVVMEGNDGARYLMKNDTVWTQVTEKGTQPLAHP